MSSTKNKLAISADDSISDFTHGGKNLRSHNVPIIRKQDENKGCPSESRKCPVCQSSVDIAIYGEHQRACFKEKFARTEQKGQEVLCQICQRDLSSLDLAERQQHVNECIDGRHKRDAPAETPDISNQSLVNHVLDCPLCGKPLKTIKSRQTHLKKCASSFNIPTNTMMERVKQQEQEYRIQLAAGVVPEKTKKGAVTKKTKKKTNPKAIELARPQNQFDEATQLAIALSASEDKHPLTDSSNHGTDAFSLLMSEKDHPLPVKRGRKRRKEDVVPELLLTDRKIMERSLADKVSKLIVTQSEDTVKSPELKPSSLPYSSSQTLWLKAVTSDKDEGQYYVDTLMPPIEIQDKPKPAERRQSVSNNDTLNMDVTYVNLAGTQTVDVLRDLANVSVQPSNNKDESDSKNIMNATGFILEDPEDVDNKRQENTLLKDLENMIDNAILSDLTLRVGGGLSIKAHKFIIAARCPHLYTVVADRTEWELTEFSHAAVLQVLEYLYTGCLRNREETMSEVNQLTKKLKLPGLIDQDDLADVTADPDLNELLKEVWSSESEHSDSSEEEDLLDQLRASQRGNQDQCDESQVDNTAHPHQDQGDISPVKDTSSDREENLSHSKLVKALIASPSEDVLVCAGAPSYDVDMASDDERNGADVERGGNSPHISHGNKSSRPVHDISVLSDQSMSGDVPDMGTSPVPAPVNKLSPVKSFSPCPSPVSAPVNSFSPVCPSPVLAPDNKFSPCPSPVSTPVKSFSPVCPSPVNNSSPACPSPVVLTVSDDGSLDGEQNRSSPNLFDSWNGSPVFKSRSDKDSSQLLDNKDETKASDSLQVSLLDDNEDSPKPTVLREDVPADDDICLTQQSNSNPTQKKKFRFRRSKLECKKEDDEIEVDDSDMKDGAISPIKTNSPECLSEELDQSPLLNSPASSVNANTGVVDLTVEMLEDNVKENTTYMLRGGGDVILGKESDCSHTSSPTQPKAQCDIQTADDDDDVWSDFDDAGYVDLLDAQVLDAPEEAKTQVISADKEQSGELSDPPTDMEESFTEPRPVAVPVVTMKTPIAPPAKKRAVIPPSPFTPMPNYGSMVTPELKKRCQDYGVRNLSKKQMRTVLKHIYDGTHQYETDSEAEEDQVQQNTDSSSSPPPSKRFDDEEDEGILFGGCEILEESMIQEKPKKGRTKKEKEDVFVTAARVKSYILQHSELYHRILQYEPLELDVFREELASADIKMKSEVLMDILDGQNIQFTMKNTRPAAKQKSKGKKQKPAAAPAKEGTQA